MMEEKAPAKERSTMREESSSTGTRKENSEFTCSHDDFNYNNKMMKKVKYNKRRFEILASSTEIKSRDEINKK